MSGVACSQTYDLFDSLSFLLEKSMSAYVSVYVDKWYLLPNGHCVRRSQWIFLSCNFFYLFHGFVIYAHLKAVLSPQRLNMSSTIRKHLQHKIYNIFGSWESYALSDCNPSAAAVTTMRLRGKMPCADFRAAFHSLSHDYMRWLLHKSVT